MNITFQYKKLEIKITFPELVDDSKWDFEKILKLHVCNIMYYFYKVPVGEKINIRVEK